jgi:signal transduction histidine kinase
MTGALISTMLRPADIEVQNGVTVPNVAAIGSDAFWGPVAAVAGILAVVSSILAAVSLFVRYRRSRGEERQQIRWLAYVGMVTVFCFFLAFAGNAGVQAGESTTVGDLTWLLFILSLALGIPVATAVAVLKYRLYDLDLVVKKTAVFTIVALFLTGLYLLGLGLAAPSGLGAIFAAILFVLTFNPVRHRARKVADRLVYGKRATPFEVLSEFSERVGETYATEDVLPRMARILGEGTGASGARAWLQVGGELRTEAGWPADLPGRDAVSLRGEEMPDLDGETLVEVRDRVELLGALSVSMPASDPMNPAKERLIRDLAAQAGLVLRNVRLIQDLRASRQRLVAAQDEERRKLERDLHDGAQQQLVALAVQLKLARTMLERDPATVGGMLDTLQTSAADALAGECKVSAAGTGTDRLWQIRPPHLALGNHHSVFSRTLRAALATN